MSEALVVSMGTGTAFIRSSLINGFSHIGGSGVGGGTIMGLCSRLTCAQHFDTITKLAERGNLSQVDLMVKDIFQGAISTLPADLTAANFGHWADSATEEDTALGVLNMVFQTVGMMAVFACRNDTTRDVVLTGSLTEIPQAVPIFHTSPNSTTFRSRFQRTLCSPRHWAPRSTSSAEQKHHTRSRNSPAAGVFFHGI